MLNKIRKFTKLSLEEKKLFLEAYILLGLMRASILTISFKCLTHSLEHYPTKNEVTPLDDKEIQIAMAVGQAIKMAAAHTPWESACLVQSLAVHRMLKKRSIPGIFYLGVMKDKEADDQMKAHSWTQCGEHIITGGGEHEDFTILSVFGWGQK